MFKIWFLQNNLMVNMNKSQLLNISRISLFVIIDSVTNVLLYNV